MEPKTLEECCNEMRAGIKRLEMEARAIVTSDDLKGEQKAQAMLAVRHLEDARMRLGKVIQYNGTGVSCYDK